LFVLDLSFTIRVPAPARLLVGEICTFSTMRSDMHLDGMSNWQIKNIIIVTVSDKT